MEENQFLGKYNIEILSKNILAFAIILHLICSVIKGKQHRLYQGEKMPRIKHDRTGLLSMVSHGDGMLGSQFVITLSGNLSSLDPEHCVFGSVVEGEELLLKLNEAITDDQHRPYQDIR